MVLVVGELFAIGQRSDPMGAIAAADGDAIASEDLGNLLTITDLGYRFHGTPPRTNPHQPDNP